MVVATAFLRLVRPLNLLITVVGVLLGGVLAAGGVRESAPAVLDLFAAAAVAVLIAAGGNSINDVFDHAIDAINRPDRPLPSGRVSLRAARGIWVGTTCIGLVAAAAISPTHLLIAAAASGLLYAYSAYLKRVPLAGNFTVSFVVGLAVVFGGVTTGSPIPAYVGAGFAVLTTFAREIVKDIEDLDGDRSVGARTAPLVYGTRRARSIAASSLVVTVLLTPLPFLLMEYGPLFLFLVLIADLMLLRSLWVLPDAPEEAGGASAWLKGAMLAGIVALFAA